VPGGGRWEEALNSDAALYGGGGMGNGGGADAEPLPHMGFDHSLRITVPPLGCVIFRGAG
jgi:1,4-alpha-glucan branching enzyme